MGLVDDDDAPRQLAQLVIIRHEHLVRRHLFHKRLGGGRGRGARRPGRDAQRCTRKEKTKKKTHDERTFAVGV